MIGEQHVARVEFLDRGEQAPQQFGIVEVGRQATAERIGLCQAGPAEAVSPFAEIDQQQVARLLRLLQLRRQVRRDVSYRRERRNDQRYRGHDIVLPAFVVPPRAHRHRVLADRDGDAEFAAQFVTHRLDGLEQVGVFARVARSGHPVGR